MIFGFSAARNIDGLRSAPVVAMLESLPLAECYITGGAIGGDAFIGAWLHRWRPNSRHVVIVPFDKSKVLSWWIGRHDPYGNLEIRFMEEGTTYQDRNQKIVDECDEMVGFPEYTESDTRSRRSGTWQTIRMARRAGKMGNPEKILILRSKQ